MSIDRSNADRVRQQVFQNVDQPVGVGPFHKNARFTLLFQGDIFCSGYLDYVLASSLREQGDIFTPPVGELLVPLNDLRFKILIEEVREPPPGIAYDLDILLLCFMGFMIILFYNIILYMIFFHLPGKNIRE